jgi:hypothetical protein
VYGLQTYSIVLDPGICNLTMSNGDSNGIVEYKAGELPLDPV